jgi:peptidoglycan-N-acetylglucosamine deacetylase
MLRPRYWLIALYDRAYRLCHRLDTPRSEVGAALRLELSWATHALRLSDGTLIARGDRIGILHMNNDRVRALHIEGLSPIAVGLEFRREIVGSLRALAVVAGPGGWADRATAFAATTIFHHGLPRLGFERDPTPPPFPHVIAAYQRSLLGVLHPAGAHRLVRLANTHVERLWLSRARLLALYGQRQRAVS